MRLQVDNQRIKVIDPHLLVSGSMNLYEAEFEFDETWNGFQKTAVFTKFSCEPVCMLLIDDKCNIPYEILKHEGHIAVGVFGMKTEDEKTIRKPTVWADPMWVAEGVVDGRIVPDPDPTIYEQLLAELQRIEDEISRLQTPTWEQVQEKPFEEIGEGLRVDDGVLKAEANAKPYISLERKGAYFYEVTFDKVPEFIENDEAFVGGCTSFVRNGKLHRNLDWNYDNTAEFLVTTKDFKGMSFLADLQDEELEGKDARIGQLPYHINDGVNNYGIMVSSHVLYNDFGYVGQGDVPIYTIPYIILTELQNIAYIHEVLDERLASLKVPSALGEYLIQYFVTNGTTSYVVTPKEDGSGYEIVNITTNPKLTNFKWVSDATVDRADLQERPTGVERFNLIGISDLEDLRFTLAYETPTRLSEFIGIDGTTKDSTDEELEAIYEEAHAEYLDRQRDGKLWQTVHSVIYSPNGIDSLWVQEDWTKNYIQTGGVGSWNDLADKPFNAIDNNTLISNEGVLKVNTTNDAEPDNTLPITSAGTYVIVGDIETLLSAL